MMLSAIGNQFAGHQLDSKNELSSAHSPLWAGTFPTVFSIRWDCPCAPSGVFPIFAPVHPNDALKDPPWILQNRWGSSRSHQLPLNEEPCGRFHGTARIA